MRKLLLSFFALLVLGTSAWGATTVTKTVPTLVSENSWTAGSKYQSFSLDANISVTTSGTKNGTYALAGTAKTPSWYVYKEDNNGKFTISAKSGYIIQTVAISYGVNNSATRIKNTTTSATVNNGATCTVNNDSVSFIVYNASTNDMVKVTQFSVTYAAKTKATAITMDAAMTVSVGNHFQIGTLTPNGAYCDWTSSDASKVSVDKYGVITAKAVTTTTVNIKAKGNGVEKTCAVTVVAKTGTDIMETFSKAEASTWQGQDKDKDPYSVDGDNGLLHWIMRSIRRATSDKVDGVQATRISYNSGTNYIAYNNSTTYPAEGGVKRVSFKWISATGANPVVFDIDNNTTPSPLISHHIYLPKSSVWQATQTFTKDVNMAKNVQFRIKLMASDAATINIGPLTITPYLLFTNKAVTATNGFYKYNDNDLINNTGENPTITVNDANAASVDEDGTVRSLQDGKTVTVTAKWGDVTTTTKLTTKLVDPAGSFALSSDVITKNIGDDDFDNAFTKTVGDAFTYVSTNEDVATVDENGKVHIVNGGTTQIKAVFAVSAPYKQKEFAYTLDVTHTPTEPYFAESFDAIPKPTVVPMDKPQNFDGTGGVYSWSAQNIKYGQDSGEKIDGKWAVNLINNNSHFALVDTTEGGIKEVTFRYKSKAGTSNPIHFYVRVGNKVVEMARPGTADVLTFAHQFDVADSVGLSIYQGPTDSPQQGHILLDTIKIVPYLLYTEKVVAASAAGGAYTNLNLINNTGTKPSYSISCSDDVATIDENGAVTIYKSDTVTVTAKWGDVTTTYTLQMQAKQIPEISFAEESLNKDLLDADFTNALTTPVGVGDTTYLSSNEDVATVDAAGKVTMHSIGQTTITVNIAENDEFAATSLSYSLTVGFTPETGTFWSETFSQCPNEGGTNASAKAEVPGDSAVYNWYLTYFQRRKSGTDDKVNDEQGIRIRWGGSIANNGGVLEGGIKAVSFNWRTVTSDYPIDFKVNADGTSYRYQDEKRSPKIIYSYGRKLDIKKNTNFSISLDSLNQAFIAVGTLRFTPYLLYTDKKESINLADYQSGTYTNDKLINNTDVTIQAGQTDIEFSVVGQSAETDKIATVNKETGAVTPVGGGTITVQAKWGEVTTTYELTINKMTYTPAFAETTVPKTMNDSVFSIALNDVPEDATGVRTYSSTNERVAKVNNDGVVTIYGPGTTDIKVEIAEDAKYKKQSTKFTLTVTAPTTDMDVTEGFLGLTWGEDATSLNGDLCTWNTYKTRRTTKNDSIESKGVKMGAEWMQGETALGYLESDGAVEGGVKRIYFTWIKNAIKSPATGDPTFMVKVGDVEDVFNAKDSTQSTPHVYLHNFNMCKNSVIKIYNNSWSNFKAGPIVITPYIFYLKKNDTIMAADYVYPTVYAQALVDNTNAVGKITYESDNTDAAEVLANGNVKVKAAAENPVTITAKWQPDESVEKYVTTSYKLFISAKKQRGAEFNEENVEVVRGVTPVNNLDLKAPKGDSEPVIEYESSDVQVAVIGENNAVVTVGPGTTTITAHIGETNKCLAQDVSYTLTVTYSPEDGTYFTEYFPITNQKAATDYVTGPDTIMGSYGFYQWELKRYRRKAEDLVNGVPGTRICYNNKNISNAYLATTGAQEGGLKEVVFDYCVPGMANLPIHFYIQAGDSTHEYYHEPITSSSAVTPYAHVFSKTSNTTLSIYMNAQEDPAQSAITVSPVKIIPYLLYTRKDTTVVVSEMASPNYKFFNNKWINNTDEGTISYTVLPKDNAVEIDGDSVKIIGEGTDTIQASWEGVTTTYVIHTVLETPVLGFDDQEVNKKVSESPYTQEVTLTTPATGTIVYSIVDDPEGASINSVTGEVTMTAAGVYTIKATFPQQLPYKQGEATYKLTVTEKTVPQISFADANVDKDLLDAAFTNTLNAPEGVGAITYVSSNEDVATVDANGLVSMAKTTGSAIITAYAAENEEYAADSAKFTLNVTYTPVAGKVWKETFSKRDPKSSKDMTPRPTVGDSAIYNWTLTNYDYNNSDNFDGVIGVRVRYDGSIVCDAMEGGIKVASFRWRSSSNSNPIHFTVKADNEPVVVEHAIIPKGDPVEFPFVRKFAKTSNASFSIKVDTAGQPALAFIGCGPITITPYLLFKKFDSKEVTLDLDKVTEFNLNDTIIDNTENGTITFAVDSFKTDMAPTINAGKVDFTNVKKGGKVYISATWAENPGVKTTLVINTTITPEVSFAVPAPAAQNLVDGSYTNTLSAPEGVGAITYESSNKQVATVDNNGVVTFLVAGTTTITAKVAASDGYKATEKSYDLTINGYTPAAGDAWVETFSLMEKRDPYVETEEQINGDSLVYKWIAYNYIRPDATKPFRLKTNGYIKTDGNQEGGIKYVALNWIAAATGNIDFTMSVNNDSYQYKSGVTVNKAYRFEHFFNADSIVPLEIKMGSKDISAYMSVVNVTVVPYLLYTQKFDTIMVGGTSQNMNMINNLEAGENVTYSIADGSEYATIDGNVVTGKAEGDVVVKAAFGDKLYTTYKLHVKAAPVTTLVIDETDAELTSKITTYAGQSMDVTLKRQLKAGMYNTIFLPFAMDANQISTAFGEGTKVAELTGSSLSGNVLSLDFDFVTSIEAGKPYLMQPANAITEPVQIEDVVISTDSAFVEEGIAKMIGTLSKGNIDIYGKHFVQADNTLTYFNVTEGTIKSMNGMRAYFILDLSSEQKSNVIARCVIGRGLTTEVMLINGDVYEKVQKVVIDNQLYIIRDARMYNAQGQLVN